MHKFNNTDSIIVAYVWEPEQNDTKLIKETTTLGKLSKHLLYLAYKHF